MTAHYETAVEQSLTHSTTSRGAKCMENSHSFHGLVIEAPPVTVKVCGTTELDFHDLQSSLKKQN